MIKQRTLSLYFIGIFFSLLFFIPFSLEAAPKNISIGSKDDQISILGELCLGTNCKTSWDQAGLWKQDASNVKNIYYNISGGGVGIGTISPQASLDILETRGFRTSGPVAFVGSPYIGSGNRILIVDNSGNVIATTSSSVIGLPSPGANGQTLRSNGSTWIANNVLYNDGTNVGIGKTNPTQKLDVNGDALVSGNVNANTLTVSGNVGIGNLNPSNKLSIRSSGVNSGVSLTINMNEQPISMYSIVQPGVSNDTQIGTITNNSLRLITVNKERVRVNTSGNVGIDTTNPTYKLDVAGGAKFTHVVDGVTPLETQTNALTTVSYVNSALSNPTTAIVGFWTKNADNTIYNTNLANVGIGKTNPSQKLDVVGNALVSGNINTNTLTVSGSGNSSFVGNVGIGTTNPYAKLHTNGPSLTTNGVYHYKNLVGIEVSSSSVVGTLKITMPVSWTNTMGVTTIKGYDYSGIGSWEVVVGGYNHTSGWVNTSAEIKGRAPFSKVRLAHDGSRAIILLGDINTAWRYPKVEITDFTAGHSSLSNWGSGWAMSFIDNEDNIASFNTPSIYTYISSTGNFGIGTITPAYKLDVAGGAKFTQVIDGVTPLETQTNALTTVSYVNSALSNPTTAIVGFWTKNADNTIYNTNLANVGIGKTNPTQKLDVVGNALVSGNVNANTLTVSGSGNSSFVGNVGIGTNNPEEILHVNESSTRNVIQIGAYNSIGSLYSSGAFIFGNNTKPAVGASSMVSMTDHKAIGNRAIMISHSEGISFHTSSSYVPVGEVFSSERMRITNSGNIGIGKTNPTYKLDVDGGAKFTAVVDGVTPLETQTNALTTVSYVNSALSNPTTAVVGFWKKDGDNISNTNSANVGIGTSEPQAPLSLGVNTGLNNNVATAISIGYNASSQYQNKIISGINSPHDVSNFLAFGISKGSGVTSEVMRINGLGKVGIGTTGPSTSLDIVGGVGPYSALKIQSAGGSTQAVYSGQVATIYGYIGSGYYNNSSNWRTGSTAASNIIFNNDGSLRISTDAGLTANTDYIPTIRFIVLNSGNVGIGKTNPAYKLDVAGGAKFTQVIDGVTPLETQTDALTTVGYVNSALSNPTTAVVGFWKKDGNNISNTNSANVGIGTTNPSQKLDVSGNAIVSGNVNAGTLTVSGSVGIGTLSPLAGLDVSNNNLLIGADIGARTRTDNNIKLSVIQSITYDLKKMGVIYSYSGPSFNSLVWGGGQGGTAAATYQAFYTDPSPSAINGGIERMRIVASGNIGIGTSNPSTNLHISKLNNEIYDVSGTIDQNYFMISNPSTVNGVASAFELRSGDSVSRIASISMGSRRADLIFATRDNNIEERMRINYLGNVGIGTTAPTQKLDVAGGAKFTQVVDGVTPLETQTDALTTVGYVNSALSNPTTAVVGFWTKNGNDIFNNNSANVGIGTTNPGAQLEIYKMGATSELRLQRNSGGVFTDGDIMGQISNWGNTTSSGSFQNANIKFIARSGNGIPVTDMAFSVSNANTGPSEALRIAGKGGNVGIGTTNPSHKLTVMGSGYFLGDTSVPNAPIDLGFYLGKSLSDENRRMEIVSPAGGVSYIDFTEPSVDYRGRIAYYLNDNSFRFYTNSSEKLRIFNDGNVGIGTTNPVYKLDVSGGAKFTQVLEGITPLETQTNALTTVSYVNSALSNPTTAIVGFWTKNADNSMYNTNLANVGIGKTNPTQKLDVSGGATFSGNVGVGVSNPNTNLQVANTSVATTNGQDTLKLTARLSASEVGSGPVLRFSDSNGVSNMGSIRGYTFGPGSTGLAFETGWNSNLVKMVIDNSGNIGVGTTTPAYKLDVSGGAKFTAVVDGVTPLETQTNALTTVSYVNSALSSPTTAIVGFWTKTGNNISNTNSANIGIGKTNPAQKLDVVGNALVSGNINTNTLTVSGSGNSSFVGNVGVGTNNPAQKLDVVGNALVSGNINTNTLTVSGSGNSSFLGNVGIGTATPGAKLDIKVGGNTYSDSVALHNGGNQVVYSYLPENTRLDSLWGSVNGAWSWSNSHGEKMRITSTGNVGIGTTTPTYKLDVAGGAKFAAVVDGVTPLETQTNAFATVGYVASALSDPTMETIGFWTKSTSTNNIYNASGTANVGIGTDSPTSLLTIANNQWISSISGNGTSGVNMFKLNNNNQIEVGAPLLIGPLEFAANSGLVSFLDMPITASSPLDTPHGYAMRIDGNNILTAYAKSDSSGGIKDIGVGIGTAIPQYSLDVVGDINFTGGLYMNGSPFVTSKWSSNGSRIYYNDGNIGIGTTAPAYKLDVAGGARFSASVEGIKPNIVEKSAFATVGYIDDVISSINAGVTGAYLPLAGGTMSGPINMNVNDIGNVRKITAQTVDPLYRISGINYSTFAPSVVGGVKEEYVGRISVNKLSGNGEYEAVIDFSKAKQGSDMWVFRKVVDYSSDNIDVLITPYGSFANTYYKIEGEKIIIRADRPVSVSYRLTGKRHDWRNWPTKATDQEEAPSFIIN